MDFGNFARKKTISLLKGRLNYFVSKSAKKGQFWVILKKCRKSCDFEGKKLPILGDFWKKIELLRTSKVANFNWFMPIKRIQLFPGYFQWFLKKILSLLHFLAPNLTRNFNSILSHFRKKVKKNFASRRALRRGPKELHI